MKYENIVKIYLPIEKREKKRTQKKGRKKNTVTTYFCFFTVPVIVQKKKSNSGPRTTTWAKNVLLKRSWKFDSLRIVFLFPCEKGKKGQNLKFCKKVKILKNHYFSKNLYSLYLFGKKKAQKVFYHFLNSTFVKIRQNWQIWPILWLQKKDDISSHISGKENIERKKIYVFCHAHFAPWSCFSFYTFFVLLMGSRVKACSFLDFKKMSRKQFERYQNFYGSLHTLFSQKSP